MTGQPLQITHKGDGHVKQIHSITDGCWISQEITGGRGVDIAIEALGNPKTFIQATQAVRDGGRAVMVGLAPAGVTAGVDISKLVRRKVKFLVSLED